MPQIRGYEQQTQTPGMGPQPTARGEQIISGVGEGLQNLAQGVRNLERGLDAQADAKVAEDRVLKAQEHKDAVAWSGKVLSDAHIQWSDQLLKAQEQAGPDAAGFTPKFLTDFDKYSEDTLKNAPNDSARQYLGERLTSMRTSLAGQALTFEAQSRRDARTDKLTSMIDNNAKSAELGTANFAVLYGESKAAIDAMELPPKEKSALLAKLDSTLPYADVLGRTMRDPKAMVQLLRGGIDKTKGESAPVANPTFSAPAVSKTVMQYAPDIQAAASAKGVDPSLMMAQLQVESGGNAKAVNNGDIRVTGSPSVGIAQFQPGTAKRYGIDPTDPKQAIQGQAAYMADLTKMFGGDTDKALAGYNWGEGNVQKAVAKWGDDWRQHIPASTQNYIKKINGLVGKADVPAAGVELYSLTPDQVKPMGDPAIDALSFQQRIQLLQHAETLNNQQMALAREQLRSKVQDFTAIATSGKPMPAASVPTLPELQAAHGEAEGLKIYNDDIKPMVALNNDLQTFSTKSVDERRQMLQSRTPLPGDGFADASKRFSIMVQADAQLTKEMDDDPSAYAMKYSPSVKASFANLQQAKTPDAAQAFVTATLAEQKRLGVLSPSILPKPVTDSIVRQFYDQKDGGQSAAVLMAQQANLWGKNWPAVYGQMAKDLPGSALVIGSGMKPQAAEMLARASTLKQGELEEGLPKDDVKTVKENLQGSLSEFRTSVAPLAGGTNTFNTFNEQITKLATMYLRSGDPANKAAQRAYDDVIGSKYDFITNGNNKSVSFRVPKEMAPSNIARGAARILNDIGTADIEVPASMSGLNADQARTAYVSALKNSAYWVTAPDESGLMLYANGAAVTNHSGKPLLRQWDELSVKTPGQFQSGVIRRAP